MTTPAGDEIAAIRRCRHVRWAPTAAYTAVGAHVLTRALPGPVSEGLLCQKVRFQASILPVSEAALSLTRSFQVPFATSEEAFTV